MDGSGPKMSDSPFERGWTTFSAPPCLIPPTRINEGKISNSQIHFSEFKQFCSETSLSDQWLRLGAHSTAEVSSIPSQN